jgi:hypothetical protein
VHLYRFQEDIIGQRKGGKGGDKLKCYLELEEYFGNPFENYELWAICINLVHYSTEEKTKKFLVRDNQGHNLIWLNLRANNYK